MNIWIFISGTHKIVSLFQNESFVSDVRHAVELNNVSLEPEYKTDKHVRQNTNTKASEYVQVKLI